MQVAGQEQHLSAPTLRREPLLSLPNLLTLVRLPMAVVVWLVAPWPWALGLVMLAAAISDVLDGWFARRMRARRKARGLPTRGLDEKGGVGAWLDPLCDKTFVVSVIGVVYWWYQPDWWLLALIGLREIVLVPLVLAWRLAPHPQTDMRAGLAGKLTTVIQFVALWSIILGTHAIGPAIAAAAAGLIAVCDYVRRALKASR